MRGYALVFAQYDDFSKASDLIEAIESSYTVSSYLKYCFNAKLFEIKT